MKIYIYIFILFSISLNAQGYLPETAESLMDFERYSKSTLGFSDELSTQKTLEMNVPPVGNQRETGSCVAWATSYYGLSTIYNRKFNITTSEGKYAHAFDPWYTYSLVNQLTKRNDECDNGLRVSDALKLLEEIGPKKMLFPPYNYYCNENWEVGKLEDMYGYLSPYQLASSNYEDPKNYKTTELIKTEIDKYGFPVVVTLGNYSKSSLNSVGSDGIFRPVYQPRNGGHAMTIVGYDDFKNGGSYRVVNSWGKEWGDDGYCWIKYSDFKKYGDGAYFLWINEDIIKTDSPQLITSNYTRTNTTLGNIYEGQTKVADGFTGLGILTEGNTYFIGQYNSGRKNGYFKIVDDEGVWYANYKNGTLVNNDELGFAGAENSLIESKEVEKYLNQLFKDIKIKNYKE